LKKLTKYSTIELDVLVKESIKNGIGKLHADFDMLLEHTIKKQSFTDTIKLYVLQIHQYANTGEIEEAYKLINKALSIYRDNDVKDHPSLTLIYIEFGLFYSRMGQLYKTIQYCQLALYYADGFNRQTIYSNFATTFLSYNFNEEATRYYKYAIDDYSDVEDHHRLLFWILHVNYAEALAKLGRFNESKSKLEYIYNYQNAPYKTNPAFLFHHKLGYAIIEYEKENYEDSINLLLEAEHIAIDSKMYYLQVDIEMILIKAYEKVGNIEKLMPLLKSLLSALIEKNQLEQSKKVLSKLIKHTKEIGDKEELHNLLLQQNDLIELEKKDKFNDGVITILNEYDNQLDEIKTMSNTIKLQKNELEQFAFVTAHNLKEPLRNISGFVQLLFKENPNLQATNKETYSLIKDNAERVELLLDNLERYTSVGYLDEEADIVNLNALLAKIASKVQKKFISRAITFDIAPLPKIKVHPTMVFNLFYELIENAVYFNSPSKPNLVSLSHKEENGLHTFELVDNAMGIDENQYNKIFQLFAKSNVNEYSKRTGLGLALCKKIVSLYKGSISVTSTKNKGSIFTFSIESVK